MPMQPRHRKLNSCQSHCPAGTMDEDPGAWHSLTMEVFKREDVGNLSTTASHGISSSSSTQACCSEKCSYAMHNNDNNMFTPAHDALARSKPSHRGYPHPPPPQS